MELDASFHGLDQLRHIRMAGIKAGASVDYANQRSGQSVLAIAGRLDEDFA